jgi:uncharacterized membrane protein
VTAGGASRGLGETGLRIALGVVAVAGLGVAGYLTAVRASGEDPACVIGGGCHTVQNSEYSELAGIPVAVLGLLAYAALLAAALLPGPLGRALGLFTAVVGVGFSAYLTYLELFVIDAICAWCVASAILILIALVLTILRARAGERASGEGPSPSPSKETARAGRG